MSKSLDFCKERASDPSVSGFADRSWNDAGEIRAVDIFDEYLEGKRLVWWCA